MSSFLKTTESYRQGARTLPGRFYTAPEVLAEEQERIFSRRWICIGRDNALATPGDYMLVEIAGESIIVLRDQSGERRAFYNVCRHRGTRLCEAERGPPAQVGGRPPSRKDQEAARRVARTAPIWNRARRNSARAIACGRGNEKNE